VSGVITSLYGATHGFDLVKCRRYSLFHVHDEGLCSRRTVTSDLILNTVSCMYYTGDDDKSFDILHQRVISGIYVMIVISSHSVQSDIRS
jgi:hypothetical protein